MPKISDVIISVETNQLIKDPYIKNGYPIYDNGQILHYSGGFAVVFPFQINSEKWAFRCWTSSVKNVDKHLKALSKEMEKNRLPYFCEHTYVEKGICVNGEMYPTTRMKWVDGVNIKDYICINKNNKKNLIDLAGKFLKMCKDLGLRHMAHGDLQHGNILVDRNNEIKLIDYDSVYSPILSGETDVIKGLADYQHPNRKDNKYVSEKLDYFSELIIYLSIVAIAENPKLVDKYRIDDSESLLFTKSDYSDIKNSMIYYDIEKLGGQCHELLEILVEYLNKEYIDDLVPFYKKLSISYKIKICVAFLFLVIIIVTAVFFIKSSSADHLSKFKKDVNVYIKRDVKNMDIKALDSLLNVCEEFMKGNNEDKELERIKGKLETHKAQRKAYEAKLKIK